MRTFFGYIALPFLIAFIYIHYIGMMFAVSLVSATIAAYGFHNPLALAYLHIGLRVYAGVAVFSFGLFSTMSFQFCCIGFQTFWRHMRTAGWIGLVEDVLAAIIWPLSWYTANRNLEGWGLSLADAIVNAVEYWTISHWRGVTFSQIDTATGKETTVRVKTPEDAEKAMAKALSLTLGDKRDDDV